MKTAKLATQKVKLTLPKIVNITQLRATPKQQILLHFTDEQWNELVKDVEKVDNLAQHSSTLTTAKVSGGIVVTVCGPGCTPIYEYSRGTGLDAVESVLIGCDCLNPEVPNPCHIAVRRPTVKNPLTGKPMRGKMEFVCVNTAGAICAGVKLVWTGHILGCSFDF